LAAVETHGYRGMLLATSLAGVMQLLFGVARLGGISRLFPSSVIRGMLVAIGLILVLQQVPVALGWSGSVEVAAGTMRGNVHWGAILLAAVGIGVIVLAERLPWLKKIRWLPGPLLAVIAGVGLNELLGVFAPSLALGGSALVDIPTGGDLWA